MEYKAGYAVMVEKIIYDTEDRIVTKCWRTALINHYNKSKGTLGVTYYDGTQEMLQLENANIKEYV